MPPILSEITVRPAAATDIPALLALEERSFSSDRLTLRSFRHLITRAHCDCLVASRSDKVLGCAVLLYRRKAEVARLHSLAIDPALRGTGIGAFLLRAAEEAAHRHGASILRLAVRTDNQAATMLYQSQGYKGLATVDGYYGDGMSAYSMEKALVASR